MLLHGLQSPPSPTTYLTLSPQHTTHTHSHTHTVTHTVTHNLHARSTDGPTRPDTTRKRTYRTKEETEKSKNVTSTVVVTLLIIAVVVPMLQYYGYVAKD